MKLFVKFMLFIVVAALAAPFVLKGPDGRPLMSLDKLRLPTVSLPDFGKTAEAVSAGPKPWPYSNGRTKKACGISPITWRGGSPLRN